MIQVREFKEVGEESATKQCNAWLADNKDIKLIDIKYNIVTDEYFAYTYLLLIYDDLSDQKTDIEEFKKKLTKFQRF